jgi:transposase
MPKRIQLPDDFYKHDFKQLAKVEKHPRTRIRFIGLSHIQNGKSYEQVAQYLLQSLSAVKQWVRHYKDEGIDGLKEKQRSGRPSKARNQNHTKLLQSILAMQNNKNGGRVRLKDIQNMLAKDFNIHYQNINGVHYIRDLCINRNNHQKPTFHPLSNFLNPTLALLGQGLKKSPIGQKLDFANHPYLCKGLY